MNIVKASVHRPIFTIMVVLIVIILGGVSLFRLPVDLMPDITYPTLSVVTTYANASPEEMEELVTRPIEQAMTAVPGVTEVTSSSTEGRSTVRVTFAWGTDLDVASNDIRDRLDRVIAKLPDDADRPFLRKFDAAAFPILFMGASSDMAPLELRHFIEDQIQNRIERVPGVASMDIRGGLVREIHVDLLPDRIKALGLSIDQVLSKIKAANQTLAAGTLDRGNYEVTIRTPGQFTNLDEIRNTVVAMKDGAPIPVHEIAHVRDSWQRITETARINGKPGIRLAINKQSGTNTVDVASRVVSEIERINKEFPQIKLTVLRDTSDYIRRSINNVSSAAVNGGLLAVVILLLFLRQIRSTLVIAIAIPICIIATFVLLYFYGFTLNLMTLGGLALGVGMMVDNSIVVLENIVRLREEEGMAAEKAAVEGTNELIAAVMSSTLTTVVVFLPLIFVRGMSGVMFKQLALVITFSLLCSLVVAVTLVPMLATLIVRVAPSGGGGAKPRTLGQRLFVATGRVLAAMENRYKSLLRFALDHRWLVVVVTVLLLAGSVALIPLIGVEFMPQTDEGQVVVNTEMEVGTRLGLSDQKVREVEDLVRQAVPEAVTIMTEAGGGGGGPGGGGSGSYTGQVQINLKPRAERTRSSQQIADDLRQRLQRVPGMTARCRAGSGMFFLRMSAAGAERLQIEVRGHDFATADALAQQVKRIVQGIQGTADVRVSREAGGPEDIIHIDRQKAADLKLTVSQIANALQTLLAGTRAGSYRESGDEYYILVKLENAEKMDLEKILQETVTNADGQPVVLRSVVQVRPQTGPTRIERKNQERIVTVLANLTDRDMGSVLAEAREKLRGLPMPSDFSINFTGDYEEQQKSFKDLLLSLALSLVLVYMVMACQYESLRDPFVVMFSVPVATIGVVLVLFLTNTTFNVQSFIGCIMLGGIVVNNAILLVDHTNLLRRRDKMALREAIEEAGRRRLRPILMTALTTIVGLLPLALALGEGGEAQAPLARAVIGGLASATLITLVVIPVAYSLFERRMSKEVARGTEESGSAAAGSREQEGASQ